MKVGYRVRQPAPCSADIATFYNSYTNLRSAEPGTPFVEANPVPTDVVVPFVASNKMGGKTYGAELFGDWRVIPSGDFWLLQLFAMAYGRTAIVWIRLPTIRMVRARSSM